MKNISSVEGFLCSGQLCEDEDGHLAHEFLEESADGLRLVAGKRI